MQDWVYEIMQEDIILLTKHKLKTSLGRIGYSSHPDILGMFE